MFPSLDSILTPKVYRRIKESKTEIIPNLFVGNWHSSLNFNELGLVICINHENEHTQEYIDKLKEKGIKFMDFRAEDYEKDYVKMRDIFECSFHAISKALRNKKIVLVHCTAGMNRSATIVANFIIRRLYQLHSDLPDDCMVSKVISFMNSRRDVIWPSKEMLTHLRQVECEYIDKRKEVEKWMEKKE